MVPKEAPYPDVYTDIFIFFLRSLCKIIWMNVHYFPNAPRMSIQDCILVTYILFNVWQLQAMQTLKNKEQVVQNLCFGEFIFSNTISLSIEE